MSRFSATEHGTRGRSHCDVFLENNLHDRGLIQCHPGQARSLKLLVPAEQLWTSDEELFARARRELFSATMGDTLDLLGHRQFLPIRRSSA